MLNQSIFSVDCTKINTVQNVVIADFLSTLFVLYGKLGRKCGVDGVVY